MKIEVNVSKKHMFAFVFVIVAFSALFFAYAYGSTPANPPVFGHTPSETGQGADFATFGGTSTFNGPSGSQWFFPGILSVGGPNPGFYTVYAVNHSSDGFASVGISGGSTGKEELGFIHNNLPVASIYWNALSKALEVNGFYKNNTIINGAGGKVGIGKDPAASSGQLQVAGSAEVGGTLSAGSVGTGAIYASYLCMNAGTGPINPSTDPHCANGIPLQNNVAINSVTLTQDVVRTNSGKAAMFVSVTVEPNVGQSVTLNLKSPVVGSSWIAYTSAAKYGGAGYGRLAQMTAFVPAGWSYKLTSSDSEGPWSGFETTLG